MKKIYVLILVLTFIISPERLFPQNIYSELLQNISTDSMVTTIKELSGYVPVLIDGVEYTIASRLWTTPGKELARRYLQQRLNILGISYSIQSFDGDTGKNILAVIPGTLYPEKKYIICAHYDSFSPNPALAPGADDNASGVSAVLEAARLLKEYSFPYTVIFALWDEEEKGRVGSIHYAVQAKLNGDSILGVINFDMISYDSNNDNKAQIRAINLGSSVLFANKIMQMNTDYNLGIDLVYLNPGHRRSDHASFWDYGFGAICIIQETDFNRNPNYHKVTDTFQYINLAYMTKLAKVSIITFAFFAGIKYTPVELVSFNAYYNGTVKLEWITASELNNKGFEIQRRNNTSNWKDIAFITGQGTTEVKTIYLYEDHEVTEGAYYYRIKQIDLNGSEKTYDPVRVVLSKDMSFTLQNFPNPFNPKTNIKYTLPRDSKVILSIYNILSQQISELVNEEQRSGEYTVEFNGKDMPSGMYIYQLKTEHTTLTKPMLLLK